MPFSVQNLEQEHMIFILLLHTTLLSGDRFTHCDICSAVKEARSRTTDPQTRQWLSKILHEHLDLQRSVMFTGPTNLIILRNSLQFVLLSLQFVLLSLEPGYYSLGPLSFIA